MEASVRPRPHSGLPALLSFIFPDAHTPFTLFPFSPSFLCLCLFLSLFSTLFPPSPSRFFHDCPLPARHRPMLLSSTILLIFSPFHIRHCIFLSPFLYLNLCFSLPFSLSLSIYLHPRSWPFNGTSRDSSLPRSELLPSRLKWKLLPCPIPDCRPCETKLPDNPLICPVITSHSRFDTAGLAGIAQVGSLKSPTSRH